MTLASDSHGGRELREIAMQVTIDTAFDLS